MHGLRRMLGLGMQRPVPERRRFSGATTMMNLVMRNMVSVSDCSTVTSGARLGPGRVASAVPKSSEKMATCRIWFCATA